AWPTLEEPRIAYAVRDLPTRLGMVAAGLGIALLPGIATASVPGGVRTLTVDDRAWPGRATVVVTRRDRPAALTALVAALRDPASHLDHSDATEPFGAAGMTTFTSRR